MCFFLCFVHQVMAIGDLGPGGLDSWGWIVMKGVRTPRIPNHPPTPPIYHYIVECKHIVVFGSPPKEPTDAFHRAGGLIHVWHLCTLSQL